MNLALRVNIILPVKMRKILVILIIMVGGIGIIYAKITFTLPSTSSPFSHNSWHQTLAFLPSPGARKAQSNSFLLFCSLPCLGLDEGIYPFVQRLQLHPLNQDEKEPASSYLLLVVILSHQVYFLSPIPFTWPTLIHTFLSHFMSLW